MARVDSKGSRMEKRMMEGKTRNRDEADLLPSSLHFSFLPSFLFFLSTLRLRLELKKTSGGIGEARSDWDQVVHDCHVIGVV